MSEPPPPPGPPPPGGPPRRSKAPLVIALVVVAVVVVVGAVLLAQGGDERSDEEQAYVDALAEWSEAQQAERLGFDEEESRCFAEAIVDAVGVGALQEAATPEEIRASPEDDPLDAVEVDRSQAEAIYDDTDGCIEYREVFLNAARRQGELSDAQLECLDEALTDDLVRNYLVATFDEEEEALQDAEQAFDEAAASCENA